MRLLIPGEDLVAWSVIHFIPVLITCSLFPGIAGIFYCQLHLRPPINSGSKGQYGRGLETGK